MQNKYPLLSAIMAVAVSELVGVIFLRFYQPWMDVLLWEYLAEDYWTYDILIFLPEFFTNLFAAFICIYIGLRIIGKFRMVSRTEGMLLGMSIALFSSVIKVVGSAIFVFLARFSTLTLFFSFTMWIIGYMGFGPLWAYVLCVSVLLGLNCITPCLIGGLCGGIMVQRTNPSYCPKCGAELPLEAIYCPKCGAKVVGSLRKLVCGSNDCS